MQVEYTALKRNFGLYADEYREAYDRVFRSGWYILGPELESFERVFADWIGTKYCVGLGSGTDALILSVRALGIGQGDEVIVPAGTYIASVLGITENGATPVYVDSNEFLLMDTDQIESKISSRTKAILPVHLYGQSCNMSAIKEIADRHGLAIIEDCAQCHGSTWEEKKAGSFGTISCFSFYPTKPLGAFGDAGCICTDDKTLADRVRMLRNYGSRVKYHNESIGVNSRLDEVQAAILMVGLRHLEEMNDIRISFAKRYLSGIHNEKIKLPDTNPMASHVFHLFPVLVDERDGFREYLLSKGIKTQTHYPIPPYVAECFAYQGYKWEDFPHAMHIAQHEISLPLYSGMTMEEVDYVSSVINLF